MSSSAIITPPPPLPFYTRLKNWIKEHFRNLPQVEVQVSSTANYVVPFVEELDELVDPAAAPVVNPILDRIKVGLAAVATTVSDASGPATTANAQSIMASLTSNAAALETAFQVKDPATQERVSAILTLLNGEFSAISADLGTPKS